MNGNPFVDLRGRYREREKADDEDETLVKRVVGERVEEEGLAVDEEGFVISKEVEEINLKLSDVQFVDDERKNWDKSFTIEEQVKEKGVVVDEMDEDSVMKAAFFSPFLEDFEEGDGGNRRDSSEEGGYEEVEVERPVSIKEKVKGDGCRDSSKPSFNNIIDEFVKKPIKKEELAVDESVEEVR